MRNLIFVAVLSTTVSSLSFWEKAQGYISGGASANASANVGGSGSVSGSNFLSGLQNSSFGQAVMGGIDMYNQAKNGSGSNSWQTALGNSSFGNFYQQGVDFFSQGGNGNGSFIDAAVIQQTFGNSSFGEVVQSGIEFYNNLKNGNSPFAGDASSIIGNFVPFLANASTEAKTEFYALLPNIGNMTIAEMETAIDAWAAKYGLTEEVQAFNRRSENATAVAEEHANSLIMNLPNVVNNLKAINDDKNQTLIEKHTRLMNYVNSLDEDTKDIVFVLFKSFLPPQFTKPKCIGSGGGFGEIYQQALEFFSGNGSSLGMGSGSGSGSGKVGGGGGMFGNIGQFFSSFNGNGNGNNGSGNGKPHPMIGVLSNFMNKNNISESEASAVMSGAQHDGGFASIQILPAVELNVGGASLASDAQIGLAVIDETHTTKKNKKQQQQANKNKKKTTTVAPLAADANVALEVHAQVL
ncbi:hypothetical protein GCK72_014201 [Caenorhabditis remanei]|uniref:SXP/RAL-2 family protein Ani s 5-like cation-binding domain-containing protein n=1 Tax=Caenorhabditis remanei TaxID=31234 RepID=A0A6A5GTC7_CAERE|nr:hypothetical protein GCK72_014201 [Caenorhabditis remanei]KAF1757745.1 hypothetical protein GCK72_014201 [Caenorhabditis remanei]